MPIRDEAWPPGTPCWVDYSAADLDGAQALYSELFGWTFTGGAEEFGGYLTAQKGGKDAAGMAPQMDPAFPPAWSTWFASDDVDATAARIREAGGRIVAEPMDVGPMGRMCFALDPQGNGFGVWQSGINTGVRVHDEPGALAWTDAAVDDPAAAQEFYTAVFGFRWTEMPGMEGYSTFSLGDPEKPVGGLGGHRSATPRGWTTCFATSSTDDAVAAVERAGGKVVMPAQDTQFGRFAVLEDPWGATFAVMQEPARG